MDYPRTRAAVIVTTLLCAGALGLGAAPLDPAPPIAVETRGLAVRLAAPHDGMGFLEVRHKALGKDLLKAPASAAEALIWKLELTLDASRDAAFYGLTNRNRTCERRARTDGDAVVLEWLGLDLREGQDLLDVRVTVLPRGREGLAEWRLEVVNRGTQTGIYRVVFPVLEFGVIGDSGADDYLLAAPAEGRAVREPLGGKATGQSYGYWDVATDGEPALRRLPDSFGFGAQRPHGLPYPTARGQMQFCAYYEKPGHFYYATRAPAGGVYLATYDGAPQPKVFFLSPEPDRGVLTYEVAHYPEDQAKAGLAYTMPYPVILDGFSGDWYDAARLYRSWATRQAWTQPGPLHRRPEVPAWVKQATCVLRIDVKKRPNAEAVEAVETLRRYLPGPLLAQWYNWAAGEKTPAATGYAFPPVADAAPGFAEILKRFAEQDVHVMPYVNSRLWNRAAPRYAEAEAYAARNRLGGLQHTGVVEGDQQSGAAYMCDQTEFWATYLDEVCRQMQARFGVEALYLDQLTGAHFGGALARAEDISSEHGGCWNRAHGHPLGVTRAAIANDHRRLKAIVEALSTDRQMLAICGEGSDETLVGLTPVKLIHYEIWPGYVPLFATVYHDYITAYGRTAFLVPAKGAEADPMPQMTIGWQFVCGNQLGRVWLASQKQIDGSPVMQRNLAFLAQAAELRHRHPEFLCLGELLRPPLLSAVPEVATTQFRRVDGRLSLPAVLAGTFRAADGRIAVVLTNIGEAVCEFDLGLDFGDLGIRAGSLRLVRVFPEAQEVGPLQREGTLALRLAAREVALILCLPR